MTDFRNKYSVLQDFFGHSQFRNGQEQIIDSILAGRDCLGVMPTGAGKSMCYQIPALMFDGITIVVSPLISLMKDQVNSLIQSGVRAAYLNSSLTAAQYEMAISNAARGMYKIIYVAPERLMTGSFLSLASSVKISMLAVDEAHCVSQWGQDFRPSYMKIPEFLGKLPYRPIVSAFTATATAEVKADIIKMLELRDPFTITTGFDRKNLYFGVSHPHDKYSETVRIVEKYKDNCGIIYCSTRKNVESVCEKLCADGYNASRYHAGLSDEERRKNQDDFIFDRVQVMVATNAFGMGIDKSNVSYVIHYNMPKSIECYYQEIGRAGRDGMKGDTLLFYSLGDVVMLSKFAEESGQKKINLEKLRRMQQYAESPICRRRILLSYFGETVDHDCGNCDVCKNPPQRFDGSVLAQKALSAIVRTEQQVTFNLLIDVLRGSHKAEILKRNYDKIKTFGVGSDLTFRQWQGYLLQMLQLGLFEMLYNQGERLSVTELGWKALRNELEIKLTWVTDEPVQPVAKTPKKTMRHEVAELSDDEKLFEALRGLRMKLAVEEDKPAYTIFTDRVLQEMVERKPVTLYDFARISGVGEVKVSRYGKQFVDLLRKELNIKREKGDSYIETLMLLRQGLTIEQVAESRNLKPVTIYSHIAELIISRKLTDWSNYISVFEIESVANVISSSESKTQNLKPIYEALNGEIDYGKIRLALAVLSLE